MELIQHPLTRRVILQAQFPKEHNNSWLNPWRNGKDRPNELLQEIRQQSLTAAKCTRARAKFILRFQLSCTHSEFRARAYISIQPALQWFAGVQGNSQALLLSKDSRSALRTLISRRVKTIKASAELQGHSFPTIKGRRTLPGVGSNWLSTAGERYHVLHPRSRVQVQCCLAGSRIDLLFAPHYLEPVVYDVTQK